MIFSLRPRFLVHFNEGAVVSMRSGMGSYRANFLRNGVVEYSADLRKSGWAKTSLKYHIPWKIEILDRKNNVVLSHDFDLTGKTIRINIDSRSLGDTLAWVPQVARFAELNPDTAILISQFFNGLGLAESYPQLQFIEPDTVTHDVYATYCIGYYFQDIIGNHPVDPRTITLGKVASDILGLEYHEQPAKLIVRDTKRPMVSPYVCIATRSTAGCKEWQHAGGWQRIVDYLQDKGLKVIVLQKEATDLENVIDRTGDLPLRQRMTDLMHCEFFIGLGSGLSWLAWSLAKPVILISGFSNPIAEFQWNCRRIINNEVCHGCWNSTQYEFDKGDWNWCSRHKGTQRQFECTREIQPERVISEIDGLLSRSCVSVQT